MYGPMDPNHPTRDELYPAPDPRGRRPPSWLLVVMIFGALGLAMLGYSMVQLFTD